MKTFLTKTIGSRNGKFKKFMNAAVCVSSILFGSNIKVVLSQSIRKEEFVLSFKLELSKVNFI